MTTAFCMLLGCIAGGYVGLRLIKQLIQDERADAVRKYKRERASSRMGVMEEDSNPEPEMKEDPETEEADNETTSEDPVPVEDWDEEDTTNLQR